MNEIAQDKILYQTVVPGGWNFSHIIRRGRAVRLRDIEGGANVSALFYNADNFSERYNMGDTLKIQHISSLFKNACIYADTGRILMSLIGDSLGWHDVICGVSYKEDMERKPGYLTYQQGHNDFFRNGYDSLLGELAKHGMGKRDFTNVVNFFSKVNVDSEGGLEFVPDYSAAGSFVDLRAEMDTLLVLDTGMHPLNPAAEYLRRPVEVTIYAVEPAAADDPCRTYCEENVRGFKNSEDYYI